MKRPSAKGGASAADSLAPAEPAQATEGVARTLRVTDPPLSGRTGAGVGVAVIDSGANVPHSHLPGVAGGVAFDLQGETSGDLVDVLGHGTAVAAAIHEKAPDAQLHAVKVFDRVLATSAPTLVRALDWASERGLQLVNLSLGTPNPARVSALEAALERARTRGTVVVSALGHGGEAWYPGTLAGVVGVRLDPGCPREEVRIERSAAGRLLLLASPLPRPIPGVPPERNLSGISFAVANVTGLLALLLEARPELRTAEEVLGAVAALARQAPPRGPTPPAIS